MRKLTGSSCSFPTPPAPPYSTSIQLAGDQQPQADLDLPGRL